jgi:hypothetical protein
MRSKQKSTVSKPWPLRAFQGHDEESLPFPQGSAPNVRVDHLGPQPHPVSPANEKPRAVAAIDSAQFPADAEDRRFTALDAAAYLLLVRRGPCATAISPANLSPSTQASYCAAA